MRTRTYEHAEIRKRWRQSTPSFKRIGALPFLRDSHPFAYRLLGQDQLPYIRCARGIDQPVEAVAMHSRRLDAILA